MPTINYALLNRQLEALLDTRDWLTNSAQMCAFIQQEVPDLNWVGFYLQRQPEILGLGPFQGKPAATPSLLAKAYAEPQRVSSKHSGSMMYTPSQTILPAMPTHAPSWSFPS